MKDEKNPEISVIITTHADRGVRCKKAIESVLSQTFSNFEVIVVDDHSTDDTETIVLNLMESDKRVRYIKLTKNSNGCQGVGKNAGIKAARGKYIAYLDSDNTYREVHLQALYEVLESAPFLDAAYGDRLYFDEESGKYLDSVKGDFDPVALLNRNYIDISDIMHRRETIEAVGGWDEKIKRMADWDLFARMAKNGAIFWRVPVILTDYILHNGSLSKTKWEGLDFSSYGSEINAGYLGEKKDPKVAIYTLTKDRLDYTKRCFESMRSTTKYPFDHFVVDNGSTDGTVDYIAERWNPGDAILNKENVGISKASNQALDMIGNDYDVVIKVDNDCEFITEGWLEAIVDIFKRNHQFILSPYVEGLRDNPGGSPRGSYGYVIPEENTHYLGVTHHIGGLCCAAWKTAYLDYDEENNEIKPWRWPEETFLHGDQDTTFSRHCLELGIQPAYMEEHRVVHMDTTAGQEKKYPEYFELRKKEKTTKYQGE